MADKISVISLGCPKNTVDSDNLTRKLIGNGFLYLNAPEDADILLINTCGFIEAAKKESESTGISIAKLVKYYKDTNRMEMLLEEKVIKFLKENAQIKEVKAEEKIKEKKEITNEA